VNHYEALGLTRGCTDKDVKLAYYKMAKRYHPDTAASEQSAQDKQRFVSASAAYEVLKDPQLRAKYDRLCQQDTFTGNLNDYQIQSESDEDDMAQVMEWINEIERASRRDRRSRRRQSENEVFDRWDAIFGHADDVGRRRTAPNFKFAFHADNSDVDTSDFEQAFQAETEVLDFVFESEKRQRRRPRNRVHLRREERLFRQDLWEFAGIDLDPQPNGGRSKRPRRTNKQRGRTATQANTAKPQTKTTSTRNAHGNTQSKRARSAARKKKRKTRFS
jgi:DnaJ-class molecular chaperone